MPCDSSYLEPRAAEVKAALKGVEDLKAAVDKLVHYCDTVRDTLEAYFDGDTIKLPAIEQNRNLVEAINAQIAKVEAEYAFSSIRQEADAMFDVAGQVIAQFDRIADVVRRMKRGDSLSAADLTHLRQDQIQHRMGDMMRVYRHFANKSTLTPKEIAAVSNIDITKPLTPQLGFDPDSV